MYILIGMRGNQHFVYDTITLHIIHVATHLCLDCDLETRVVFMEQCSVDSKTQKWSFYSYNTTLILRDLKKYFQE